MCTFSWTEKHSPELDSDFCMNSLAPLRNTYSVTYFTYVSTYGIWESEGKISVEQPRYIKVQSQIVFQGNKSHGIWGYYKNKRALARTLNVIMVFVLWDNGPLYLKKHFCKKEKRDIETYCSYCSEAPVVQRLDH